MPNAHRPPLMVSFRRRRVPAPTSGLHSCHSGADHCCPSYKPYASATSVKVCHPFHHLVHSCSTACSAGRHQVILDEFPSETGQNAVHCNCLSAVRNSGAQNGLGPRSAQGRLSYRRVVGWCPSCCQTRARHGQPRFHFWLSMQPVMTSDAFATRVCPQ